MHTHPSKPTPVQGDLLEAVLNTWGHTQRQHWIPITGRSMLPLLREGDQVLVAHGNAGVRRGDIVVFRREEKLIAHRVVRISGSSAAPMFVTKGDHVSQCDAPLHVHEMIGRVLTIKRGHRHLSLPTPTSRLIGRLIALSTVPCFSKILRALQVIGSRWTI